MNPYLQTARSLVQPLYEFIFPATCVVCECALSENERRVCNSCWSKITAVKLDDAVYRDTLSKLTGSGHVSGLVSAYYFDEQGPLQAIIHQLKYGGMTSLGVVLGKRLGAAMQSYDLQGCGLVPVPLHATKLRERGYNQSAYICKGISEVTGSEVFPKLLKRTRYTQSQTKLSMDERRENVSEAFAAHPSFASAVHDRTFLLVDDVITTGATIDACAKVLIEHGAKRVVAGSVALAP